MIKYSKLAKRLVLGTALAGGWAAVSYAAPTPADQKDAASVDAIIVTARRREESLQNVPMTVTAVTNRDLKQYNINNGADLQALAPGLQFQPLPGASDISISIRGAGTGTGSAATPTVQVYLNEAPIENHVAFVAYGTIYDIGQVEVLRGPQGTLRGEPASSGAITFSTARPNLESYGGYASVQVSDHSQPRIEAAVNLPIIQDKLAVRFAMIHDHNDNDGVDSVNDPQKPYQEIDSWRASVRFKPTSTIDANVMYEQYWSDFAGYNQVFGPGYQQLTPGLGPASNFSGPPVTLGSRLAVEKEITHSKYFDRLLTGNLSWDITPNLSMIYVGSYFQFQPHNIINLDLGNFYPIPDMEDFTSPSAYVTQELRFDGKVNKFWDFGVGGYYEHYGDNTHINEIAEFLPGDFGNPGLAAFGIPPSTSYSKFNPLYAGLLNLAVPVSSTTEAIYVNSTFHLTPSTELFGGIRYTDYSYKSQQIGSVTGTAATGVPSPFCGLVPGSFPSTAIPGQCDLPVNVPLNIPQAQHETPLVYQASLTQHFGENITGYVSYGHSWRASVANYDINSTDPKLLAPSKDETSDNYEVGAKSSWLNHTLTIDVAVFDQKYKNFQVAALAPYINDLTATPTVNTPGLFNVNADAEVKGFDLDVGYRPSHQFFVNGSLNYARGRLADAPIPCSDSNHDGIPDNGVVTLASFLPGQDINYCKSSESLSNQPDWSANLTAEYNHPIAGNVEAYIRTLATYTPQNNFALTNFVSKSYSLVDLYIGVRTAKWDVGLYARNLFDTQVQLFSGIPIATPTDGLVIPGINPNSGYTTGTLTERREFGFTARYAF